MVRRAILDANVLYPAPLRDLFVRLAIAGLYEARWTEMIHDEWTRSVLRDKPDLDPVRIERTRQLMNGAVRTCLVTGYEGTIPDLVLPDPDDRHVLAAAIHAGAGCIVTNNLRDFPEEKLAVFGVKAIGPDEFLADLFVADSESFRSAVQKQLASLKNPPVTISELLARFENLGLRQTTERIRKSPAIQSA